jgi:hypothetical protein
VKDIIPVEKLIALREKLNGKAEKQVAGRKPIRPAHYHPSRYGSDVLDQDVAKAMRKGGFPLEDWASFMVGCLQDPPFIGDIDEQGRFEPMKTTKKELIRALAFAQLFAYAPVPFLQAMLEISRIFDKAHSPRRKIAAAYAFLGQLGTAVTASDFIKCLKESGILTNKDGVTIKTVEHARALARKSQQSKNIPEPVQAIAPPEPIPRPKK